MVFIFCVLMSCIHLTSKIKSSIRLRLKFVARCDSLETCFDDFKCRSYHFLVALHPGDRVVLPRTTGISNVLSHTLEVYLKVLYVLSCVSEGPFRTVVH